MKKSGIIILITICSVLVADLVTKHFLFDIEYFNLIPNVISIATNGGNSGAAWGIFSGKIVLLIVVSALMITVLFIFNYFVKEKSVFYCLSFGFIIGGALGNLVDRLSLNYVRDFIFLDFFPTFPVFNLADTFLCVGAIMMALYILFSYNKKEK